MSRDNRQQRRREINTPGHAHELTFSCYRGFPFLHAERTCTWLAEAITQSQRKFDFALWAYVFMPEHVHLIVSPQRAEYRISQILSAIKTPVAQQSIRYLRETNSPWLERITRSRGDRQQRVFWQSGGGFDRNIVCGRTLLKMINYVHENPVRRELVHQARNWRWSSAAYYEGGVSVLPIDPIPAEWLLDAERS